MISSSQRFGDVDQSVPFDDPHLKQAGIAVQYAPALDDTANCQMLMSLHGAPSSAIAIFSSIERK